MENGGKAAQPPALFVMTGRRPGHLLQLEGITVSSPVMTIWVFRRNYD